MNPSRGRFVWYELMTGDAAAAEAFYTAVVGWQARDAGLPDRRYTVLSVGAVGETDVGATGVGVGGVMALPPEAGEAGMRPAWLGYIGVDDVDAFAARVRDQGGHVHKAPEDIPSVGRFAVVADPHHAAFMLFKPASAQAMPQATPGTPGLVGWHELMAGDLDAAWAFYSALFGWEKAEALDLGPMGLYQTFSIDGVQAGALMTRPTEMAHAHWRYYVNVDAIDAAADRVRAHGGEIVMGPHEVPGGNWIVHGRDPQGAGFALLAAKR